jgi:uncharacterized protein (TIGR04168 family)
MTDKTPRPSPHAPRPCISRIAVIGDVHLDWNRFDVDYFNASDYDLLLFVGDIAAYRHRTALPIARSIASLKKPSIVMPGNHDAVHVGQLVAEVFENGPMSDRLAAGQPRRARELDRALGNVAMGGYTRHPLILAGRPISVITGRPHSMGGPRLAFRRHLQRAYGVAALDDSSRRLVALVDQCGDEPIVFLAHNGPSGFGARRDDIWGCDFRSGEGDFGDPDLARAVDHARASGRRVLAVIAGHMHHHLKGGGQRRWREERGGTLFVNAARVPRIFARETAVQHHHVEVCLDDSGARATERLILSPDRPLAGRKA